MNNSKIDTIEIQSKVLGKAMAMKVYVPADFTEGLPTLYFMHGRSGDESIIHALDIQTVADRMIADGRMKPMLIIALNYAFRHPYLFERVGGHMPAIEDVLDDDDLHYFGTSEQWKANNPLFLVQKCTLPSTMEIYLDAGSEDEGGFYRGCAQLAERLAARGAQVQNHLNEGHHTIDYIKAHLEEYLMFYAK